MSSIQLLLISVILGTCGQLFFKAGTTGVKLGFDVSMIRIFLTPYVIAGLACYVVSTTVFLKVLSQESLSFAYPLISLTYPLVLAGSMFFFKENVSISRWLGVLLIMIGVFLIGKKV